MKDKQLIKLTIVALILTVVRFPHPTAQAQSCVAPPADLIAWYPGDDNADDIVGGNNGTLQNGTAFAPGKVGDAFSFDGVDDAVVIPHNANQNGGTAITVDAWVNPSSSGHGRPIVNKRTTSNVGYTFESTDPAFEGNHNGLQFQVTIGGTFHKLFSPAEVLTNGSFRHVAATYDGSMMRIYSDGVEVANLAASGSIDAVTDPLVIGHNVVATGFDWQGLIDEVDIFNRALSQTEIQAIADAGSAGKCKGGDSWARKSFMPTARETAGAAVVNDIIYVIGGDVDNQVRLAVNEAYDPTADSWTTKASMPTPRSAHLCATVNGKIYAIGGVLNSQLLSVNEEYDPTTDTWTTKAPMPTARTAQGGVVNGKIYVIGGYNGSQLTTVEAYDPSTDTWQTGLAPAPFTSNSGACAVVNSRIYVMGGQTFPGKVQIYDPATDSWSLGANMLRGGYSSAAAALSGKINVFGGAFTYAKNIEYDPATDTWTRKTDVPIQIQNSAAAVVNGKAYLIGGSNRNGFRSVNFEYTPE